MSGCRRGRRRKRCYGGDGGWYTFHWVSSMYIEECSRKKKETWRRSSWRQEFNSGTCAWMCALFLVRKALPMQSRLGHTCTFRKVSSLCIHAPHEAMPAAGEAQQMVLSEAAVRVRQSFAKNCLGMPGERGPPAGLLHAVLSVFPRTRRSLPAPGGTHPQGSLGRRDPLRTAARIHSLCTQTDVVRRQDSRSHVGPICRGLWMRRESYGLPVREGAASVFP